VYHLSLVFIIQATEFGENIPKDNRLAAILVCRCDGEQLYHRWRIYCKGIAVHEGD